MKTFLNVSIAIWLLAASPVIGQIEKGSNQGLPGTGQVVPVLDHRMTAAQLKAFLQRRTSGDMMGNSFGGYTSMLWAFSSVGIWDKGCDVDSVRLQSPFPKDYRPTWQELMDNLATQVGCRWHYNFDTGYWVFEKKPMRPPFVLTMAKDWTRREEGACTDFIPPTAPVGMDVYVMGHYSADDPAKLPATLENARKNASMLFAQSFKTNITDKDFTVEQVCGEPAQYFTAPTPRGDNFIWRQWVFVKNGWCFVIVSVISKADESKILPEVKGMIASFAVPAPK